MLAKNGPQCTDYAAIMQFNTIMSENDEAMSGKNSQSASNQRGLGPYPNRPPP